MLKHIIVIVLLSILVITSMPYVQQGLQWILAAHDWIADVLREVFSGGPAGNIIRELLALLVIPIVIALIPTIIYWLVRRRWFPWFMEVVWVVWLIQTAALVVLYKLTPVIS